MHSLLRPTLAVGLIAALGLFGCAPIPQAEADSSPEAPPEAQPMPPVYETVSLPTATVHVVTIPDPMRYPVRVAVVDALAQVDQIAAQVCEGEGCAAAAINAGFFDPNNGLTTSHVVTDGARVADPSQNERLVGNPDLASYMDRILNRSEFRRYDCGGTPSYDITFHLDPVPADCALVDAVGAGPQLLPQDTSVAEGFVDRTVNRDALGSQSPNARSAVGLKADGSVVLVMAAQVPGVSPSGMTMAEVAEVMRDRGVVKALNLDGGSSSTLIYQGTTHFGRLNTSGERVQRPVKSILWVENLR